MSKSPESQPGLPPISERAEAGRFADQLRSSLLADEEFRAAVLKQRPVGNPNLQRLIDKYSDNEDVNNFLVEKFFCDTKRRTVILPKGDHTYAIHWQTSADDDGEIISIEKNGEKGLQTEQIETVFIDTTPLHSIGLAMDYSLLNGHESILAPKNPRPHIQAFLDKFPM